MAYTVYSTVEKDVQMNHTAQGTREIVLTRFSVCIQVCAQINYETCRTHAKKFLHSICLQIHADHVTFSFEKRLLRQECKEHSVVCMRALMIILSIKLCWLFIILGDPGAVSWGERK